MSTTLYRKYRPQKWNEMTNQNHIKIALQNEIETDKVTHAYLFCGPRGVGKTTLARLLAKSLNCVNRKEGEFEPCNECESCREITTSRAIDVIEIDAASHTGVDNVRENIIENAQFRPTKSPYKIFIIDEAHMLTTSAFNALLKTLEEPPDHVIFILATTEAHKLLETIISRCQKYDFKKISYDNLEKHLKYIIKEEEREIDQEVIDRIIAKSDGCARDAISLLDQLLAIDEKVITSANASLMLPASSTDDTLTFIIALIKKNEAECFEILEKMADQGVQFKYFATDLIKLLRLFMLYKISPSEKLILINLDADAKKKIDDVLSNITAKEIVQMIDIFLKRIEEIDVTPIPQLPLEMAVVEWASEERSKIPANAGASEEQPSSRAQVEGRSPQISEQIKITAPIPPLLGEEREVGLSSEGLSPEVPSPVETTTNQCCTLEEIKSKWSQFLNKMESQSPSLVFILKMAEIKGVKGNAIQISVQYPFHADKLQDKNCKLKVEETLLEILGKRACLEVVVNENKTETPDLEMQNLAAALGGEVV